MRRGTDKSGGDDPLTRLRYRVVNTGRAVPVELLDFVGAIERKLEKRAVQSLLPMLPGDVPDTFARADLLERLTGYRPSTPVAERRS